MNVIVKIWQKYREGKLTEAILRRVKEALIRRLKQVLNITPFYFYKEGIFKDDWQGSVNDFDQYEKNIQAIAENIKNLSKINQNATLIISIQLLL